MSDPSFESRLQRLFADSPPCPDAPLFALQIEHKLARAWALRRMLIGAAGVVGGLVAVVQIAGAGLGQRFTAARRLMGELHLAIANSPMHLPGPLSDLGQLPFGGEAIWMVAGLAVLAGALLASRSLEQL